jgi:hypothetical protein
VFISVDPFAGSDRQPASQHAYLYVRNNPVNLFDPTGHCAEHGDADCWIYLENHFCSGGLCQPGHWWDWILVNDESVFDTDELRLVKEGLLAVLNYANRKGRTLTQLVGDVRFRIGMCPGANAAACYQSGWTDTLNSDGDIINSDPTGQEITIVERVNRLLHPNARFYAVLHELGHSVSRVLGGRERLRDDYLSHYGPNPDIFDTSWSAGGLNRSLPGELWADAFAAMIYGDARGINVFYDSTVTRHRPRNEAWLVGGRDASLLMARSNLIVDTVIHSPGGAIDFSNWDSCR